MLSSVQAHTQGHTGTHKEPMKVEDARDRLIEKYIIQAVDQTLAPGEIVSYLNHRIKTGTGRLFDEAAVTELLALYGFSEYVTWQSASIN